IFMGVIDIYNASSLCLTKPNPGFQHFVVPQSQSHIPSCLIQGNGRRVVAMASAVPSSIEPVNEVQQSLTGDSFIRPHLRKLSPYQPILPFEVLSARLGRKPEDIIKLDANENPYGPPPEASYPESRRLRAALAEDSGLESDYILAGCGADELIDLIMRCVLEPGDKIVDCPPTFTMYEFDAAVNGALVIKGLAGLRVGYGAFPLSIIKYLWRAKQPYNVSVAAEISACAALQNPTYLEKVKNTLVQERDRLYNLLKEVPFLNPYPSYSNFILCEVASGMDAKVLKEDLAKMGVMIRHYNNKELRGYVRVSVGKPEHTDVLMECLRRLS
ncbi:histidinol-phosphate aminotransferase, partial [Quercus suber]